MDVLAKFYRVVVVGECSGLRCRMLRVRHCGSLNGTLMVSTPWLYVCLNT
jgi:hypothetical protein